MRSSLHHVSGLTHVLALMGEMDKRHEQRFLANQTAVTAALLAAEKAVAKAEMASEKRFESVNEFRAAYQDIIAAQMPRAEAEQRWGALAEKMDILAARVDKTEGRSTGISAGWGYLVGAVAVMGAVLAMVLR